MSKHNSNNTDDYELMPVKPIHDLKREFQSLRDFLKKENSASKILVKHMNLDIHLQKKLDKMMEHQEKLRKRLDKITNYFEQAIDEEEEERKTESQLLLARIEELSEQNKNLHNKIDLLMNHKQDIITKIQDIKTSIPKMPGSYLLKYRRTKNM